MMLMVGGMSQGKLPYALEMTGLTKHDVAEDFAAAKEKPIFYGLHTAVRRAMEAGLDPVKLMAEVAEANPDKVSSMLRLMKDRLEAENALYPEKKDGTAYTPVTDI